VTGVDDRRTRRHRPVPAGIQHQPPASGFGRTVTVEQADTTFRVFDGDQLLTEVRRTTTATIARSKARKPETR
jgi:hypothetical protein